MKIKLIYILLFISFFVSAQTAEEIVNKINANYKTEVFNIATTYSLYNKNLEKTNCISKFSGIIYKQGKNQYTKIKETEVVQTATYNLMVNHEEKIIMITASSKQQTKTGFLPDGSISEMFKLCKEVKLGKNKIIFIEPKASAYFKIEIWYNKQYQLEKIAMYSDTEMQTEDNKILEKPIMLLSIKQLKNTDTSSYFNYSRFLIKKDNKILLKDNYKDYKLINRVSGI